MYTSRRMRALTVGVLAVTAHLVSPATPVMAASGTATITRLIPASGRADQPIGVSGAGCVTNGVVNRADVFLRGPGASTALVFRQLALVNDQRTAPAIPAGSFVGTVVVPANAVIGSTYTVSAQCTEQGQPPGPESAGVVFTVTAPGTGPAVGDMVTGTTTGVAAPGPTTGAPPATTGRATPIPSQPRFTG